MKELQYKNFSLATHKKNWRINKSNVCQFELTFGCDFHCLYCYSDCYNNPDYTKNELSTGEVKAVLDKIYDAGCLWVCFTGGDPIKRKDFLEIYSYAKQKGFIITIFTNGYSLNHKIIDFLKEKPPFVIEITLNAATKKTFEEISGLPDSYERALANIKMLTKNKIHLKIKTMLIKNNLVELPKIERLVTGLGCEFRPSPFIHARLNRDTNPCSLRVGVSDAFKLYTGSKPESKIKENRDCLQKQTRETNSAGKVRRLFNCAAGSKDSINISPYGRMFFCSCLREPSLNILKQDIKEVFSKLFPKVSERTFTNGSPCSTCKIKDLCYICPGKAFLEKGDMELPVEWLCQLAHLFSRKDYPY